MDPIIHGGDLSRNKHFNLVRGITMSSKLSVWNKFNLYEGCVLLIIAVYGFLIVRSIVKIEQIIYH